MHPLYPIIRRARRPLLPPDEPQQRVVIPVTVEPSLVESVPLVVMPLEPVSVEPAPVVEPPARRQHKERNRAETSAT
jgi:hypothetical protein